MHKRLAFLSLIALSLAGCKVEHVSQVTDSQLEGPIQTVQATARIEVAACTDYQDKSKPSNSLIEANNFIQKLFTTSEFHGCKNENLNSIATYTIPMDVGTIDTSGNNAWSPKNITIAKNQQENVFFCIPQNIIKGIQKYEQQPMSGDIDLTVIIKYINDSKSEIPISFWAAYANNAPYVQGNGNLPPNGDVTLTLSNVSSDQALKEGAAFVFTKVKDKKQ